MSATALVLILGSVALHVGWNALSRRARPSVAFFWLGNLASSLCLLPVLFWQRAALAPLLAEVWPALIATGLFSLLYNVCLAGAYRRGDLSLVYPLARSLGPAGVAPARTSS